MAGTEQPASPASTWMPSNRTFYPSVREWLNTWFHPFRGLAIWGILPPWRHLSGDRPLNCCLSVSLLCICLWVDPGFSLCSSVGWKKQNNKKEQTPARPHGGSPLWRRPQGPWRAARRPLGREHSGPAWGCEGPGWAGDGRGEVGTDLCCSWRPGNLGLK